MYTALLLLSAQIIVNDNTPYRIQTLLNTSNRGDGGPASEAILYQPSGLAEDAAGNLYVSEEKSNRIRRILPDGVIETYATVNAPTALLITPQQDLLFFDNEACMIRKIKADDRTIVDIAGSGDCAVAAGTPGFGGPPGAGGPPGGGGGFGGSNDRDGKALETTIGNVGAMIYDNEGRLTFSETSLHIVRRLNPDGNLVTIVGTRSSGFAGDNEKAEDATLSSPVGIAIDADNNLYIADAGNCRIRRVDATFYIETYIGATSCASSTATLTGTRTVAIEQPGALVFDRNAKALLIALPRAYRVLRYGIDENRLLPILGNGKVGITPNANPLDCPINETGAMLQSASRGLLIAAPSSFQIFRMQSARVERFAGRWPQLDPNQILDPRGVIADQDGSLLLIDYGTQRLLRIAADSKITVLAGTTYPTGFSKGDNGPATEATLDRPVRIARRSNGDILIAEASKIRLLTTAGILRTIRTGLSGPAGFAFDSSGRLIFSDSGNHRVMRMDLNTNVATRIAGGNGDGFSGDGDTATSAKLNSPGDVAVDSSGNVIFADRENHRIRRIGTNGKITTIAGNGLPFAYADFTGELATRTGLGNITGLTIDAANNLYISEEKRLTRILSNGRIEILTGYQSQADDGTVTWLNETLEDADAVLLLPDGSLIYAIRSSATLKQAFPGR